MTHRIRALLVTAAVVVMAGLSVPKAEAASLSITKAEWRARAGELRVEGRGVPSLLVVVTDAITSAPLGTATITRSGWSVRIQHPSSVPCRVRASSGGVSLEMDVRYAPSVCPSVPPTPAALTIIGPSVIPEASTAAYTAVAEFSDGTTADVTAQAKWGTRTAYAAVSGGVVTTSEVPSDQPAVLTASYTGSAVTVSAQLPYTIQDTTPAVTLDSLAVQGPSTLNESTSASYQAIATYSDGSTSDVTAAAAWSQTSSNATVAAGVLSAGAVTADEPLTLTASLSEGSTTRAGSLPVTILDVPPATGSHAGRFATYEGTKTCLTCHRNEAMDVHASVHYQWQGDASATTGLSTANAGKLGGINDFCIYPDINWIGQMTNTDGVVVDGGCAKCHVGLGAKPTAETTDAQLENIDCLVCHSADYRRKVEKRADGSFAFVPDTTKMQVSILQAAWNITRPTSGTCLDCHTKAGGGDNNKRGDIEEAHRTATAAFDVHLAPVSAGGAGLSCLSCHVAENHRIAGRGSDLRPLDRTATVACTNCHPAQPHDNSTLNAHTARVDCTVCHIPTFARGRSTDMLRNWSAPGDLDPVTKLYDPHMTREANVVPEYRFFKGTSYFYQFGDAAVPGPSGSIVMSEPNGAVTDPGAKIHPFKHHRALQPIDPVTRVLLPLKIGLFFQTGNVDGAIHAGVQAVGWQDNGYEFASTERFLEINHEVAPATQALQCSSCHGGSRMDFTALGYAPLATRNGKPLCSSCHSAKQMKPFYDLHNIHVENRRLDCANCHAFSKAN